MNSRLTKYLPLVATMLACITTTVALSYAINEDEHQKRQLEFNNEAQTYISLLRGGIAEALQLVRAQQAVHGANRNLTRKEFREFISPYLGTSPAIRALEWIPRVSAAERPELERRIRSGTFSNFRIIERSESGEMVPAKPREEYYPVLFLEPLAGNEKALGYDLASETTRRNALHLARDTGKTIASGRIRLVQDTHQQFGVLIFAPVYRDTVATSTRQQRRNNLRGFALGVLQVGGLVEQSIAEFAHQKQDYAIYLFDSSASGRDRRLYPFNNVAESMDDLHYRHLAYGDINVGDRIWRAVVVPRNPVPMDGIVWDSWLALVLGLGLSLLLGTHLWTNIMRGQEAELRIIQSNQQLSEANEELQESEARIRAVVDNVTDGIITIDDRGNILSMNTAAMHIFGYSQEEVVGRNVKMLMPEPYYSQHDGFISNYLRTGEARIIGTGREVTGLRRDGSQFPMELNIGEIKLPNQHLFTGVVRDITERNRIDRMQSEFVSMVSHELRTPLTSIHGSLGLLVGGIHADQPEKSMNLINLAYRNSDRLGRLINDVLDLEKLTAGKMEFQFRSVQLTPLVKEALEVNGGFAEKVGVKFELEVRNEDVSVYTDSDRVIQVLTNLLSNAVKYSPENGTVAVSTSLVNGMARIAVTDKGDGVPEEFRARLFHRFAQADNSDSRNYEGTGLGLSIAREMVDNLGGSIGFHTKTKHGSTFYIDLPLSKIQIQAQHNAGD